MKACPYDFDRRAFGPAAACRPCSRKPRPWSPVAKTHRSPSRFGAATPTTSSAGRGCVVGGPTVIVSHGTGSCSSPSRERPPMRCVPPWPTPSAPEDWRQEALTERVALPVPALARLGHGHVSLRQAAAHLPGSICRDYFKFAFVRHPFDRFVSVCAMLNRRDPPLLRSRTGVHEERHRPAPVPRPRAGPAAGGDADHAGRRLRHGLRRPLRDVAGVVDGVCDRIGLERRSLDVRNVAQHGDYRDIFDAELGESVAAFYREDFARLDYEVPACV